MDSETKKEKKRLKVSAKERFEIKKKKEGNEEEEKKRRKQKVPRQVWKEEDARIKKKRRKKKGSGGEERKRQSIRVQRKAWYRILRVSCGQAQRRGLLYVALAARAWSLI